MTRWLLRTGGSLACAAPPPFSCGSQPRSRGWVKGRALCSCTAGALCRLRPWWRLWHLVCPSQTREDLAFSIGNFIKGQSLFSSVWTWSGCYETPCFFSRPSLESRGESAGKGLMSCQFVITHLDGLSLNSYKNFISPGRVFIKHLYNPGMAKGARCGQRTHQTLWKAYFVPIVSKMRCCLDSLGFCWE